MTDVQGDLFASPEVVAAATQAGIDAAAAHADPYWKTEARHQIQYLARTMDEFASDDLAARLRLLGISTHKNNMMASGHLFTALAKEGVIFFTGRRRPSRQPQQHRQIRIWGSVARAER